MSDGSKQNEDFRDLQAELAGGPNGKAVRFLGDVGETVHRKKDSEAKARRDFLTQLDFLLQNPAYRAAYERTMQKIDEVQDKLNKAVDKLARRSEHLEILIRDLEEGAPRLEDGTAIFRDKNGNIKTADGRHLESEAVPASLLLLLETSPSYEQYEGARDALQGVRNKQHSLGENQSNLDGARDRMKNGPNSVEKVEAIERELELQLKDIESKNSMTSGFSSASNPSVDDLELEIDVYQKQLEFVPS